MGHLAEDLKGPRAPLKLVPWELMKRAGMKATAVEASGRTGGLQPKEPNLFPNDLRRDTMTGINPVDAHSAPHLVAQHDVDPTIADDFKGCSPNIVREPVEVLGVSPPPSRCCRAVRRANMANWTTPTALSGRGEFRSCGEACWWHRVEQRIQDALCPLARGGVERDLALQTIVHDETHITTGSLLEQHEPIRPQLQSDLRFDLSDLIHDYACLKVTNFEGAWPSLANSVGTSAQSERVALEHDLRACHTRLVSPVARACHASRRPLVRSSLQNPVFCATPLRERTCRGEVGEMSSPRIAPQVLDGALVFLSEDLVRRDITCLRGTLKYTMQQRTNRCFRPCNEAFD